MNFTENNPDSYASVILVKSVLFWLMSMLACMTILTHIAQVFGITFKIYAYIGLFLMLIMSMTAWKFFQLQYKKIATFDYETILFISITSIVGAGIASFFNTGNTGVNYDLFYYVSNVVYHLQNPDLPMDFVIHFIDAGREPFLSYFGFASLPFEYFQAIVSYFLNINYLSTFFIITPAILGFLIPIVLYYLICQFVDTKSAVVGSVFAIAIILLLGETPRTPGTWSFPNIYVGKIFAVAIGLPLFSGATINFFRTNSVFEWMITFVVVTAMVGATTTSMVLLPTITTVLVLAYAAISVNYKVFFNTTFTYLLSLSYLIAYILIILTFIDLQSKLDANSPINQDFPTTFLGHADFFYEQSGPATPLVLISSTIIGLSLASAMARKFILAWITATIVLFLNPIVAPFIIKYLTTPNIYWRLFYIYPLPLLLGLTGAALYEYINRFSKPIRNASILGMAFILFISHFVPFTTSVLYLRTKFGWPRYKIPLAIEKQAIDVIAFTPHGPMLAPLPLGGVITMLSADYPQMRVFNEVERAWFGERGQNSEIDKRICASEFVSNKKPECLSAFQSVLENSNLRSVIIKNSAIDSLVQNVLNKNGFTNYRETDDLIVFWKDIAK